MNTPVFDPAAFDPAPGVAETLAPGLRRVLAPNPSPMTFRGTNTFLIGTGAVAVIDPGPAIPAHLDAILAALAPGERISQILVTHSHLDHSPLARPLADATGAPVLAYGDSLAGRSPVMERLARHDDIGGGEGVDAGFRPDVILAHGEAVSGPDWALTALWTPGHFGNHLCFEWDGIIFTGDVVMGWASSLVSPPDGDLGAYMASLELLAERRAQRLHPAHGAPIDAPGARLAELGAHRRQREAQIRAALAAGLTTVPAITRAIYTDVSPALLPAAERNVFAHLIDLVERTLVEAVPSIGISAQFHPA